MEQKFPAQCTGTSTVYSRWWRRQVGLPEWIFLIFFINTLSLYLIKEEKMSIVQKYDRCKIVIVNCIFNSAVICFIFGLFFYYIDTFIYDYMLVCLGFRLSVCPSVCSCVKSWISTIFVRPFIHPSGAMFFAPLWLLRLMFLPGRPSVPVQFSSHHIAFIVNGNTFILIWSMKRGNQGYRKGQRSNAHWSSRYS